MFYSGISVGSVQDFGPNQAQGNIVEYNHVHDIGQGMLSDLAGIYTCSTPGSRIRYNVVHDVSRRDYGGWGIYPDEGSHDLLIQKNLVYRCQDGALFAHHNHDITAENNIFAFNRQAQIERGGIGGFELTCRRTSSIMRKGRPWGTTAAGIAGATFVRLTTTSTGMPPASRSSSASKNLAEWQAMGQDKRQPHRRPAVCGPGTWRLWPAAGFPGGADWLRALGLVGRWAASPSSGIEAGLGNPSKCDMTGSHVDVP